MGYQYQLSVQAFLPSGLVHTCVQSAPTACTLMLDLGSIIRPGNWGRIVRQVGPNYHEWQRETILEKVRRTEFPVLPSRLDCAFVIDELIEAQYYVTNFAPLCLLYEVRLIDGGAPTHEADWKGTGPYDQTNEWARRYWRGDVMPHPETTLKLRERLTLSRLQIENQMLSSASRSSLSVQK